MLVYSGGVAFCELVVSVGVLLVSIDAQHTTLLRAPLSLLPLCLPSSLACVCALVLTIPFQTKFIFMFSLRDRISAEE